MITLKRFRRLVDSYGADLQRWPESAREDAQHLLTHSAEAQAWLDGARHWDQVIAAAGASEDRAFWPAGEQDAALARLRLRVEARITQRAASSHSRQTASVGWDWLAPLRMRWLGLAAGGGFAVMAGLVIGLTYATNTPLTSGADTVLAMLQPAPLPVLAEFGGDDGT